MLFVCILITFTTGCVIFLYLSALRAGPPPCHLVWARSVGNCADESQKRRRVPVSEEVGFQCLSVLSAMYEFASGVGSYCFRIGSVMGGTVSG